MRSARDPATLLPNLTYNIDNGCSYMPCIDQRWWHTRQANAQAALLSIIRISIRFSIIISSSSTHWITCTLQCVLSIIATGGCGLQLAHMYSIHNAMACT